MFTFVFQLFTPNKLIFVLINILIFLLPNAVLLCVLDCYPLKFMLSCLSLLWVAFLFYFTSTSYFSSWQWIFTLCSFFIALIIILILICCFYKIILEVFYPVEQIPAALPMLSASSPDLANYPPHIFYDMLSSEKISSFSISDSNYADSYDPAIFFRKTNPETYLIENYSPVDFNNNSINK